MSGRQSSSPQHSGNKDHDHRSEQLNPNNDAYWQSRGEDSRPEDWEERIQSGLDE